jgi:hypothetical protein
VRGLPCSLGAPARCRCVLVSLQRSDLAMLMDSYNLWANQLFPRMCSQDVLAAVEKLSGNAVMKVCSAATLTVLACAHARVTQRRTVPLAADASDDARQDQRSAATSGSADAAGQQAARRC